MQSSETISLLRSKIVKILTLLLLIRLGLYIPVPNIDLNLFESSKNSNIVFGFAKTLTGSSFLGIGSLGILPYINSSILIQLLTVPVQFFLYVCHVLLRLHDKQSQKPVLI